MLITCGADLAEVTVPATLQATIAARIDRLDPDAKQTLNAAAVIGSRFTPDLLDAVGNRPVLDALVKAAADRSGAFHAHRGVSPFDHPLIRSVAYESQLKSDRARLHRRLAAAIEAGEPESADQNAALDRRTSRSGGRLAERLRLAHARGNVGDTPRHRCGTAELGECHAGSPTH